MTVVGEVEVDQVSLCGECAKHPELKDLVESDLADGVCGVCGRNDVRVFDPAKFGLARNLIRALIRFHFDEEDYNPHWGGTSVSNILLDEQNPIIRTTREDTYADDFIDRIESEGEVYPSHAEGIWLYAGHDDDYGRGLQFSIPNSPPGELRDIEHRLDTENFHAVEPAMTGLVERIEPEIEAHVEEGALWFRARVGVAETAIHFTHGEVIRLAKPYRAGEIGALPPPKASAGRMNRAGVSVLYFASQVDTALAELRPHPAHRISVGGFRARERLRIANFDLPIGRFSASDERLDEFALIHHIDTLLSRPIIPEERSLYAPTQLLADTLIRRGFDGVSYRSSVGTGKNLCVFRPDLFAFDDTHSSVQRVDALAYKFSKVPETVRADWTP